MVCCCCCSFEERRQCRARLLPVCRKLWCVAICRGSFSVAIAGAASVGRSGEVVTFLSFFVTSLIGVALKNICLPPLSPCDANAVCFGLEQWPHLLSSRSRF